MEEGKTGSTHESKPSGTFTSRSLVVLHFEARCSPKVFRRSREKIGRVGCGSAEEGTKAVVWKRAALAEGPDAQRGRSTNHHSKNR